MTIKEYSFEKLTVWNEIRDLIRLIYSLTSIFPIEEKFGISNQMRRSAISIGSNLAEGSSKNPVRINHVLQHQLFKFIGTS